MMHKTITMSCIPVILAVFFMSQELRTKLCLIYFFFCLNHASNLEQLLSGPFYIYGDVATECFHGIVITHSLL